MMDPMSFSVMAYQTAPSCLEEIDKLKIQIKHALQLVPQDGKAELEEAYRALEVMLHAISKFNMLQNWKMTGQDFSDLDALEYECSTTIAVGRAVGFPEMDFEMARKSCYGLLSYVMGFLRAFSNIYTHLGHAPRKTGYSGLLDWNALHMSARVAWVENQLLGWTAVEHKILHCRDFHSRRPFLKTQAVSALSQWSLAKNVLSGSEGDRIELKVISARGLPKSHSYMIKVVSSYHVR